jgi:glycosyltransferase involved in cell wall biosynthesis
LVENPLISILMTAYNREAYIAEAIESVLSSTYRNFELIIVDDCSKDRTVEISRSYEKNDNRIKVFVNKINLGDYPNRNHALEYASGKYIKYLDSDDLIYENSLEIFVSGMERFPDAAVGIMSTVSQDGKPYPYMLSPAEAYNHHFYKRGIFSTGPSALIFNAEKIKAIGAFSGRRYVGDTEINLRLAAKWPVVLLCSSLIFWRQHPGQEIESGMNSVGYLESNLPLFKDELNNKEIPLSDWEKDRILKYYRKTSAREILRIAIIKRRPGQAIDIYKKLALNITDLTNAIIFPRRKY